MKAKVKDILNLIGDDSRVCAVMYAYGIYYADTMKDGMNTVAECKKNMNHACMNARVTGLESTADENGAITMIYAELAS